MLIEPEAERVHQHYSQQAIAQMPQVPCPHPLEVTAVGELSTNGIDEIAHASQDDAVIGCRFGGMGPEERVRATAALGGAAAPPLPQPGQRSGPTEHLTSLRAAPTAARESASSESAGAAPESPLARG